jgi:hypothetical protein
MRQVQLWLESLIARQGHDKKVRQLHLHDALLLAEYVLG